MNTKFDPFRDFTRLGDEMSRVFGDVYRWDESVAKRGQWTPPVDIFETESHDLVIKAELPDMSREDIEVTVEHNTLTLRGDKKVPSDVTEEQFRRLEFGNRTSTNRWEDIRLQTPKYLFSVVGATGVLPVAMPFARDRFESIPSGDLGLPFALTFHDGRIDVGSKASFGIVARCTRFH